MNKPIEIQIEDSLSLFDLDNNQSRKYSLQEMKAFSLALHAKESMGDRLRELSKELKFLSLALETTCSKEYLAEKHLEVYLGIVSLLPELEKVMTREEVQKTFSKMWMNK